jgi:hypothetical protein
VLRLPLLDGRAANAKKQVPSIQEKTTTRSAAAIMFLLDPLIMHVLDFPVFSSSRIYECPERQTGTHKNSSLALREWTLPFFLKNEYHTYL